MAGYDDPTHEGNSPKYHTGKLCIEGCGRPAGTAWGPYWCFECNIKRIRRVDAQLNNILNDFSNRRTENRTAANNRTSTT